MDFELYHKYPPGDPILVDKIVCHLKAQGIFDHFRKECLSDVDTKPAYQNLRQRVDGSVAGYLAGHKWKPDLNKNQLRESLRKHIQNGGFLEVGVERIVDQVVNPKIGQVFLPRVRDVVFEGLGLKKEIEDTKSDRAGTVTYVPSSSYTNTNITDQLDKSIKDVSSEAGPDLSDSVIKVEKEIKVETEIEERDETANKEDNDDDDDDDDDDNKSDDDGDGFKTVAPGLDLVPEEKIDGATLHLESQNDGPSNESCDSHISGISDLTSVKSINSPKDSNDEESDDDDEDNIGESVKTETREEKKKTHDNDYNLDETATRFDYDDDDDDNGREYNDSGSSPEKNRLHTENRYESSFTNFSFMSEFSSQAENVEIESEQIDTSIVECFDNSENKEESSKCLESLRYSSKTLEQTYSNYDSDTDSNKHRKENDFDEPTDTLDDDDDYANDGADDDDDECSRGLNSNGKEYRASDHFEDSHSETDIDKFDSTSKDSIEIKPYKNTSYFDEDEFQKSSEDEHYEKQINKEKEESERKIERERKDESDYRREKEKKHHSKHKNKKEHHYSSSGGESRDDKKDRKTHSTEKHRSSRDVGSHSTDVKEKESKLYESPDSKHHRHSKSKHHGDTKSDEHVKSKDESDAKSKSHKDKGKHHSHKDKHSRSNSRDHKDGPKENIGDSKCDNYDDAHRYKDDDHKHHRNDVDKKKHDSANSKNKHSTSHDETKTDKSHHSSSKEHSKSTHHKHSSKEKSESRKDLEKHSKDKRKYEEKSKDKKEKDKNKKNRDNCKPVDKNREDRRSADRDSSGAGDSRGFGHTGSSSSRSSKSERSKTKLKNSHGAEGKSSSSSTSDALYFPTSSLVEDSECSSDRGNLEESVESTHSQDTEQHRELLQSSISTRNMSTDDSSSCSDNNRMFLEHSVLEEEDKRNSIEKEKFEEENEVAEEEEEMKVEVVSKAKSLTVENDIKMVDNESEVQEHFESISDAVPSPDKNEDTSLATDESTKSSKILESAESKIDARYQSCKVNLVRIENSQEDIDSFENEKSSNYQDKEEIHQVDKESVYQNCKVTLVRIDNSGEDIINYEDKKRNYQGEEENARELVKDIDEKENRDLGVCYESIRQSDSFSEPDKSVQNHGSQFQNDEETIPKIRKKKFAANLSEVRKIIKARRRMKKLERKRLRLMSSANQDDPSTREHKIENKEYNEEKGESIEEGNENVINEVVNERINSEASDETKVEKSVESNREMEVNKQENVSSFDINIDSIAAQKKESTSSPDNDKNIMKYKKPKLANNIFEVRKIIKARKRIRRMEMKRLKLSENKLRQESIEHRNAENEVNSQVENIQDEMVKSQEEHVRENQEEENITSKQDSGECPQNYEEKECGIDKMTVKNITEQIIEESEFVPEQHSNSAIQASGNELQNLERKPSTFNCRDLEQISTNDLVVSAENENENELVKAKDEVKLVENDVTLEKSNTFNEATDLEVPDEVKSTCHLNDDIVVSRDVDIDGKFSESDKLAIVDGENVNEVCQDDSSSSHDQGQNVENVNSSRSINLEDDLKLTCKFEEPKSPSIFSKESDGITPHKDIEHLKSNVVESGGKNNSAEDGVCYFLQCEADSAKEKLTTFKSYLTDYENNYSRLKDIEKSDLVTSEFALDKKFDPYLEKECGFQVLRKDCVLLPPFNDENYHFDEASGCYMLNNKIIVDHRFPSTIGKQDRCHRKSRFSSRASRTVQSAVNKKTNQDQSVCQDQRKSPVKLRISIRNPKSSIIETEEINVPYTSDHKSSNDAPVETNATDSNKTVDDSVGNCSAPAASSPSETETKSAESNCALNEISISENSSTKVKRRHNRRKKSSHSTDMIARNDEFTIKSSPETENNNLPSDKGAANLNSFKITLSRNNSNLSQIVSPKSPSSGSRYHSNILSSTSAAIPSESESRLIIGKRHSSITDAIDKDSSMSSPKKKFEALDVSSKEKLSDDAVETVPDISSNSYSEYSDEADNGHEENVATNLIGEALKNLMEESGLAVESPKKPTSYHEAKVPVRVTRHQRSQRVSQTPKATDNQPKKPRISEKTSAAMKQQQRYDSSDLYKPRFDFGQSTRRKRKTDETVLDSLVDVGPPKRRQSTNACRSATKKSR